MIFKFVIPVLLLAFGAFANLSDESNFDITTFMERHERKMQLMLKTYKSGKSASRSNSNTLAGEVSDEQIEACFDYYFNLEREISLTYNRNYRACIITAAEAKRRITEESAALRAELLLRGQGVCTALEGCTPNDDILDFLQCYRDEADSNINVLFQISNDADVEANSIAGRYQRIELDRDLCTRNAQTEYVTGMASCDDGLKSCLSGETEVPSPSDPTTTTTENPTTTEGLPEEDKLRLKTLLRMP